MLALKAKERQIEGGKRKLPQNSAEANPCDRETRATLAKTAGVSHDTILVSQICKVKGTAAKHDYVHGGADKWREQVDCVPLADLTPEKVLQ